MEPPAKKAKKAAKVVKVPSDPSSDGQEASTSSSESSSSSSNESEIGIEDFKRLVKEKLATGEYELIVQPAARTTRSDAWESLRRVRVKKTRQLLDAVQCLTCKEVLMYRGHAGGSSAVSRHAKKCQGAPKRGSAAQGEEVLIAPEAAVKQSFAKLCANYCARDLRPPESMEGEGICKLIQGAIDLGVSEGRLDAKKLLPHPRTTTKYIAEGAEDARKILLEEILPALLEKRCAASTDGWTEGHKSSHYSNIVFHFIKDWEFRTRLGFTKYTKGTKAEEQRAFLVEALTELGVPQHLIEWIVFVSDGGADIVKALEEYRRLYCMCHAINIVVTTAFSVKYADLVQRLIESSPEATLIIKKATEWVHVMRNNLPKKQKHPLYRELKLTNPQSQSHTPMLKGIRDFRDQIEEAAGLDAADSPLLGVSSESVARLIEFLYPFDLAGGRETAPSVSSSRLPELYEHLEPDVADEEMVTLMKNTARQELEVMDAITTIDQVKALVAYFKRSGANSSNALSNTLKQECETRWNSMLTMLLSVDGQWDEIEKALQAAKAKRSRGGTGFPNVSAIDKTLVKSLINFLKPFQQHSEKLEGSTYPTLPYALPAFECLRQHCLPNIDDCHVMAAVRSKALHLLHAKVQIRIEHKMACMFWPLMKSLNTVGLSAAEKQEVHCAVRERMRAIEAEAEDQPSGDIPHAAGGAVSVSADLDLYACLIQPTEEEETDELTQYLAIPMSEIRADVDILTWWKVQGSVRFPTLAKVAQQILAIPAASAASERNWSDAKTLISDKATNILPNTVNDTLVLHDHLRQNPT